MKIIFLMSLAFLTVSAKLQAADSAIISSHDLIQSFGSMVMPKDFWGTEPSQKYTTFKDMVDLTKINALFSGLEKPYGTKLALNPFEIAPLETTAVQIFYSGLIHALLSLDKNKSNSLIQRLIHSYTIALEEGGDEGVSLQVFAQELHAYIREHGGNVFLYGDLIQGTKLNPERVRNIVSMLDAYYLDKKIVHVRELFEYVHGLAHKLSLEDQDDITSALHEDEDTF